MLFERKRLTVIDLTVRGGNCFDRYVGHYAMDLLIKFR